MIIMKSTHRKLLNNFKMQYEMKENVMPPKGAVMRKLNTMLEIKLKHLDKQCPYYGERLYRANDFQVRNEKRNSHEQ